MAYFIVYPPKSVLIEVVVGSNHECTLGTYFFIEMEILSNGKMVEIYDNGRKLAKFMSRA